MLNSILINNYCEDNEIQIKIKKNFIKIIF